MKAKIEQDAHMRDAEHTEMTIEKIERPFRSVVRVTARITPADVAPWHMPNHAIQIEIEASEGERPVSRAYTVRSFDEARGLLEIDFVMHEHDSPAMRWLARTGKGTTVRLTGPRPHFMPAYKQGRKAAMFADETAIPAVYSILRNWPLGIKGAVHVETSERPAFEELPHVEGVSLNLLLRAANEPSGMTGRLEAAAKAIPDPGDWTIWVAGERQEARAIRRHFIETCKLSRQDVRAAGYWKRGVSSSEIDRRRVRHFEAVISKGGDLLGFEDLDIPI